VNVIWLKKLQASDYVIPNKQIFTVYKVWKKEKRNVQATLLDSMTFSLNWIAVSKKIIGSNTHLWGAKAVQNEIVKKDILKMLP
jgi:hypothetical protein